jgi:hypothetical protein
MKHKVRAWAGRYLPGEVIGTLTALAGAILARALGGSPWVVALAATWGENLGFYGYHFSREAIRHLKHHEALYGRHRYLLAAWQSSRDVGIEFGPAEVVDSLLLRPVCMYQIPQLIGQLEGGIVLGKLVADAGFYLIAISAFELRKRIDQRDSQPP